MSDDDCCRHRNLFFPRLPSSVYPPTFSTTNCQLHLNHTVTAKNYSERIYKNANLTGVAPRHPSTSTNTPQHTHVPLVPPDPSPLSQTRTIFLVPILFGCRKQRQPHHVFVPNPRLQTPGVEQTDLCELGERENHHRCRSGYLPPRERKSRCLLSRS